MWNDLTSVPDSGEVLNIPSLAAASVFALVFIIAAFYSARPRAKPLGERYSRRFIQRASTLLGWISGFGLFLIIIRYLQINPLSLGLPIWTLLTVLGLLLAIIMVAIRAPSDEEARRRNRATHRRTRRPARRARR
ncbi:MAG TPA: hypothetical protein VGR29_02700 [Thermomicrobiales bacterium]|nr:hypothetical protein [Thermomicrobiales bacterium]